MASYHCFLESPVKGEDLSSAQILNILENPFTFSVQILKADMDLTYVSGLMTWVINSEYKSLIKKM
jgi:hypothetical protein